MRSILLASAAVLVLSQPVLADEFEQFKDQLNRESQALARDMMHRFQKDFDDGLTRMQLYDAEERAREAESRAALPMPSPTPAAPPSSSQDSYMEGYRDGHSDSFYGDGFTPHRW